MKEGVSLMRVLKLLLKSTAIGFALLFTLELIRFAILRNNDFSLTSNSGSILLIILVFPVNSLLHDRLVERIYLIKNVDLEKIDLILKTFKAKPVNQLGGVYEYKLSIMQSWERQVIIEVEPDKVKVIAPIRVIRKLEKELIDNKEI